MKILIVDDEHLARQRLMSLIDEMAAGHEVGEAEHGLAALEQVIQAPPDVVLLDIRMPVMDGLEVARHLTRMVAAPAVIFTTAYQDHALEAFDMHAVDYLLKPVRKERLQQALGRARILQRASIEEVRKLDTPTQPRTHLSANVRGNLKLLPVKDIRYFRAEQKYVVAGWPDGELLLDESLISLETEFDNDFIRIHRNALIAHKYIDMVKRTRAGSILVTLHGTKTTLQVSRRCVGKLKKLVKGQILD